MPTHKIPPLKPPTIHITNQKQLHTFQVHHTSIANSLKINIPPNLGHVTQNLPPLLYSLIQKNRYTRSLNLSYTGLGNSQEIYTLLKSLRFKSNMRKLTLICKNSGIEDRIQDLETLKFMKYLRRLDLLSLNIFFSLQK